MAQRPAAFIRRKRDELQCCPGSCVHTLNVGCHFRSSGNPRARLLFIAAGLDSRRTRTTPTRRTLISLWRIWSENHVAGTIISHFDHQRHRNGTSDQTRPANPVGSRLLMRLDLRCPCNDEDFAEARFHGRAHRRHPTLHSSCTTTMLHPDAIKHSASDYGRRPGQVKRRIGRHYAEDLDLRTAANMLCLGQKCFSVFFHKRPEEHCVHAASNVRFGHVKSSPGQPETPVFEVTPLKPCRSKNRSFLLHSSMAPAPVPAAPTAEDRPVDAAFGCERVGSIRSSTGGDFAAIPTGYAALFPYLRANEVIRPLGTWRRSSSRSACCGSTLSA